MKDAPNKKGNTAAAPPREASMNNGARERFLICLQMQRELLSQSAETRRNNLRRRTSHSPMDEVFVL